MSMTRTTILTTALVAWAGAASAAQQCGATTHTVYGETRAYFQNTLGACRPGGYCSAVLALPDPTGEGVFAQQLRIARPTPGAPYDVVLTAVTPSPTDDALPMSAAFGRHPLDLTDKVERRDNVVNEWHVTGTGNVEAMVRGAMRANTLRWTYQSQNGPTSAWFALGGVTRALAWIDCMAAKVSPAI
jgi:hypothetical protein